MLVIVMENQSPHQTLPRWQPLPAAGQTCTITGLKRGLLLNLARSGKIRAAHLREAGVKRGKWLLDVDSLLAFVEQFATQPKESQH
jgi:hypothetical protein